uniref:Uncharacterized protein n=1 Tax=Knipowitschia caucasica TaxID=637954 RepID=A0AAV2MA73_KNICA
MYTGICLNRYPAVFPPLSLTGLIQVTGAPSCPKPGSGPQMASGCPTSGQLRPRVTGWTPTSPTYGQPCPQLTVWTTTKTLYPSDSRPAS